MDDILNRMRLIISNVGINTIVDIGIVYYVLYRGYILIRDMRAKQLVKGIVLLVALIPISSIFDLFMVEFILKNTFQVGLIALVIVFQPEIRKALEYLGRTSFTLSNVEKTNETSQEIIKEIISAATSLSRQKIGALIIFEKQIGLNDITESGTIINANISSGLLINIFIPNTPLHDGAVIIKDYTIKAAGCFLPLTENNLLSKDIGTRHRAAIGMTERSDSIALIVSEETGYISYAVEGRLYRNIQTEEIETLLSGIYIENEKINIIDKWRNRNEDKKR
ncbi:MAG: diadenylate cyclase CdaA [Tissierellia bacterium]|nr:diadenylate cyclase CdaA [Tissierellia bacterium]MDD3227145.1 diadenylate cyclase CdaA [Tissierellia bacterium]MDD3751218.1 diadenylate cyclase CdaA [Tissierellia bacterium]MDD4045881.1 diadenylate cyclase CdaA [Tissierellia bacterium]MDD4677942.1 diadenylate cyclase CdaA [Tissierellia bacterium]